MKPPVVVAAEPDFGARDVQSTSIRLVFDEFVQLQDARRRCSSLHHCRSRPKRVRGREVLVELTAHCCRTARMSFSSAMPSGIEGGQCGRRIDPRVFDRGSLIPAGGRAGPGRLDGQPCGRGRVLLYRDSLPALALTVEAPDSVRPLPDYVGMVDDIVGLTLGTCPRGLCLLAVDDVNGNYRVDAGEAVAWSGALWTSLSADSSVERQTPLLRLDAPPVQAATYEWHAADSSGDWQARWVGWNDLAAGPDGWRPEEMTLSGGADTAVVLARGRQPLGGMARALGPRDVGGETWRFVYPLERIPCNSGRSSPGGPSPAGRGPRRWRRRKRTFSGLRLRRRHWTLRCVKAR